MTFSNQDDFEPDDFEPEAVDDFQADDFEPDEPAKKTKESKPWYDISETAPVKLGKAAIRGIGTTIADIHSESAKGASRGSIGHLLGFRNEEAPEPEISQAIRRNLPEESKDDEGIVGAIPRTVERGVKYGSRPEALIFGPAGVAGGFVSGIAGQTVAELGGGTGLQTAAEILTPLGLTLASVRPKSVPASLENQGGTLAKAEVRTTPKQVEQKLKNIADDSFKKFEDATVNHAKPFKRHEFNAKEIADDLDKITTNSQLDHISPKIDTKSQFGEKVQGSLLANFEEAEDTYRSIYKFVDERASKVMTSSESTINYVDALIKELESLETKPPNYQTTINALHTINNDLGKTTRKASGILDQYGVPIEKGEQVHYKKVPLDKKLELTRRVNKIIDYDLPEYNVKDKLQPVNARNKQSILSDLKKRDPEAHQALIDADKLYGETAKKYGTKAIYKIRNSETPEKIASLIDSPSTLKDLKGILPPDEFAAIERQVLENINGMSLDKASSALNEVSPYLSQNGKIAGENIVRFKDPKRVQGNWRKHANGILDELQNSFTKGTRPENTLQLMKTKDGYRAVYETLNHSPQGKKALGSLRKQYIDDMVSSTVRKDGSLDWNALSNIMNASETNRIIVRQTLGKKGLEEAERLSKYATNIEHNFNLYGPKALKDLTSGQIVKGALEKTFKQGALPLISYAVGGLPLLATGTAVNQLGHLGVYLGRRLLASPKAQNAMKELANPSTWRNGNAESVAQALLREAAKVN